MFPVSPLSQIKWFTWILGPCSFPNIKRYPSKSLRTGSGVSRTRRGGAERLTTLSSSTILHYPPSPQRSCRPAPCRFTPLLVTTRLPGSEGSLSLLLYCRLPPFWHRPAPELCPALYKIFLWEQRSSAKYCIIWIRTGLSRENAVLYEICPYLIDLCTVFYPFIL